MSAIDAVYEQGVQDALAKFAGRAVRPRAPVKKNPAAPTAQQPQQPGFGTQMAMQALPIAASIGIPMALDKLTGSKSPAPDEFAP